MKTCYDGDLVAWAKEQAAHLRNGNWSALDIAHTAEEIEDVGKSVQRELKNRMAVLLAHLLKWRYQPTRRGKSWFRTLKNQRDELADLLQSTPSLKPDLQDQKWRHRVWENAVELANKETGIEDFPEDCPWTIEQALDSDFFPD